MGSRAHLLDSSCSDQSPGSDTGSGGLEFWEDEDDSKGGWGGAMRCGHGCADGMGDDRIGDAQSDDDNAQVTRDRHTLSTRLARVRHTV